MTKFGRFHLDKEKDIVVELYRQGDVMHYVLRTPNHNTGNLITNLAKLCGLPLSEDAQGLKIIRGRVPCYIDAYGRSLYIFRLGGTKTANIYPDGRIEMKALIPSISKTLMSQTKDYKLDITKTIIKTYILSDCKFRTDLHTHMNANLEPDVLIALGIGHQIRYPLYYIKKLGLRLSKRQEELLAKRRKKSAAALQNSPLIGKYLERRIDDNTFINFADLLLRNPKDMEYNIPKIRASLAVMKDGQAVFTNLEKVYLYRYVFTKGVPSETKIKLKGIHRIPDEDIRDTLGQILKDRENPDYAQNTIFQDKLLWVARGCKKHGIEYAEISDTTLVKRDQAANMLAQVHEVMPKIEAETGVLIRFLAGIRRIPLTIIKDNITPNDYLQENLRVLRAVAKDPYVAGSDILGEEINDIRELKPVIREIVDIAKEDPSFVIRIHAGENDSLRDNVANSIRCVKEALSPGQKMPDMRIGHGLYTSNLRSVKGRQLIEDIIQNKVVLEFQITSNVRLNNLSSLEQHPLKQYLNAGVHCVQGTDGGALYGTDSIDEQLSLERLLNLTVDDLHRIREAEDTIIAKSKRAFRRKTEEFDVLSDGASVEEVIDREIRLGQPKTKIWYTGGAELDSEQALKAQIEPLPENGLPVILAGGSFNNDKHTTVVRPEDKQMIDRILQTADPKQTFFVIGQSLTGQERYLVEQNQGRFRIFAFVPTEIRRADQARLRKSRVGIRVSIEASTMGLYKSIAYEIFKRRPSVMIAFDGNSAGANLVQEAKNGKYPCSIFVSSHSRMLRTKAASLQGYVTLFGGKQSALPQILAAVKGGPLHE